MTDLSAQDQFLTVTMPERYYIGLDGDPFAAGFLTIATEPSDNATEYVRADIAADTIEELVEALAELVSYAPRDAAMTARARAILVKNGGVA